MSERPEFVFKNKAHRNELFNIAKTYFDQNPNEKKLSRKHGPNGLSPISFIRPNEGGEIYALAKTSIKRKDSKGDILRGLNGKALLVEGAETTRIKFIINRAGKSFLLKRMRFEVRPGQDKLEELDVSRQYFGKDFQSFSITDPIHDDPNIRVSYQIYPDCGTDWERWMNDKTTKNEAGQTVLKPEYNSENEKEKLVATIVEMSTHAALELEKIHELGYIHGDIKLDNMTISGSPLKDKDSIHIIDFGNSKKQNPTKPYTLTVSPSQRRLHLPRWSEGETKNGSFEYTFSKESDISSLGIAIEEMVQHFDGCLDLKPQLQEMIDELKKGPPEKATQATKDTSAEKSSSNVKDTSAEKGSAPNTSKILAETVKGTAKKTGFSGFIKALASGFKKIIAKIFGHRKKQHSGGKPGSITRSQKQAFKQKENAKSLPDGIEQDGDVGKPTPRISAG